MSIDSGRNQLKTNCHHTMCARKKMKDVFSKLYGIWILLFMSIIHEL